MLNLFIQNRDGKTTRNVRLLALAENNIFDLDLYCDLDGAIVKTVVKHTGGPAQCKFATYLIDCPSDTQPKALVLIGHTKVRHQVRQTHKSNNNPLP